MISIVQNLLQFFLQIFVSLGILLLLLLASFPALKMPFNNALKLSQNLLTHGYLLLFEISDLLIKKQIFFLEGNKRNLSAFVVRNCLDEPNHANRCLFLYLISNSGGLKAQSVLCNDDQPSPLFSRLLVCVDSRWYVLFKPVFYPISDASHKNLFIRSVMQMSFEWSTNTVCRANF